MVWVDLESPTKEEVQKIMEEFKIHPLVANELLTPTRRPKVDMYKNYIYLILHFPVFEHKHGDGNEQEVDFIVGKDFIITTHYETIDPLHDFSRVFEVNSILDKSHIGTHAGFIFFYIAKELYHALDEELDHIEETLENIEERVFSGKERDVVSELSAIHRDILNFKQSLRLHEEVLNSLEKIGKEFFDNAFSYYLRALTGEYARVAAELEGHRDTLLELKASNDSLLTIKQNEVMKILTIMAFVTFPLSLIAGIFGMNTEYIPIVGVPGDFWFVISIMAVGMIFMFIYFKYKKWI